jgi:hypothetical protein
MWDVAERAIMRASNATAVSPMVHQPTEMKMNLAHTIQLNTRQADFDEQMKSLLAARLQEDQRFQRRFIQPISCGAEANHPT